MVCAQLKSENELDVLSVLPKGWQPDSPPSSCSCLLGPSTRVTFLARRYRFIIQLDLSPSTGIVVSEIINRNLAVLTDNWSVFLFEWNVLLK